MTNIKASYQHLVDWNNDGSFDHAYSDISEYVFETTIRRGAFDGIPHIASTGKAESKLKNVTSIFSPNNTLSPIYGLVAPNIRYRVIMVTSAPSLGFTGYDIPPIEVLNLWILYAQGGGASWSGFTGWFEAKTTGDWTGITVSDGHVTVIDLRTSGADGDISNFDVTAFVNLEDIYIDELDVGGESEPSFVAEYLFTGYLDVIEPEMGESLNESSAMLKASGILSRLVDDNLNIAIQSTIKTCDAFEAAMTAAGFTVASYDSDTGQDTLSKWWVKPGTSVKDAVRSLEYQELGHIVEHPDGRLVMWDRAHYFDSPRSSTVQSTYGTGTLNVWEAKQLVSRQGIYNKVDSEIHSFDVTEDEILLVNVTDVPNGTGGTPFIVTASGTLTVNIDFPHSSTPNQYLGVSEWGIVDYEANTNALGTGTDITSDVTASGLYLGPRQTLTFANANVNDAHLVVLRAHGTAIVEENPIPISSQDNTSIASYGKRMYPYPIDWMTNHTDGKAKLDHIVTEYKDPRDRMVFSVRANKDNNHLIEVQNRREGDRVQLTLGASYGLYIDGEFIIDAVVHDLKRGGVHTATYYATAAPVNQLAASSTPRTSNVIYKPLPKPEVVGSPFTNDDPDTDSVSWADAIVLYDNKQYAIDDDNTSNEWICWDPDTPNVFDLTISGSAIPTPTSDFFVIGYNDAGTFLPQYRPTDQSVIQVGKNGTKTVAVGGRIRTVNASGITVFDVDGANGGTASFAQGILNDTRDPVAPGDYSLGSLTADDDWHDLDFSSILPAGARFVIIRALGNGTAGTYALFRRNGNSNTPNSSYLRCQVNGEYIGADCIVELDDNLTIEYKLKSTGWTTLTLTIACWWY